jgi:beta-lactamase class A
LAQENPGLLDVEVAFKDPNIDFEQNFPPKYSADESKSYTVRELLRYMIQYSDNQSYFILSQYLNEISPNHDALKETFTDLGIINPKDELDQTINVKSYGSIFVQLYHSSYLTNKDSSEYALDVLSGSDFINGLLLGVPSGTRVAHKFGERSGASGSYKQLHDCGIVYYPENPYLVCIMTQGDSFDELTKTVGLFSKMIYEEFDSRSIKQ